MVDREQKHQGNAGLTRFAQRQLQELSAGSRRTDIDAVIVVDKADYAGGERPAELLVGAATWRPRLSLSCRRRQGPRPARVFLAAILEQRSGEEWSEVQVTLSTAQPGPDATIPDLLPLETTVLEVAEGEGDKAGERDPVRRRSTRRQPRRGTSGDRPSRRWSATTRRPACLPQRGRGPRPGRAAPRRRRGVARSGRAPRRPPRDRRGAERHLSPSVPADDPLVQ